MMRIVAAVIEPSLYIYMYNPTTLGTVKVIIGVHGLTLGP